MNCIFSPIGTSVLTHNKDLRQTITQYSNSRNENDIPSDILHTIKEYINEIESELFGATVDKVKEMSAELNSLLIYYGSQMTKYKSDCHYLIPSDTYIGKAVANMIKGYLESNGLTTIVLEIKDLQTQDEEAFKIALSDLAKQIIDSIGDPNPERKIVFNLTAGFKAVQGFLQTVGMIYADEIIYVFERSNNLMRIPRLPITFTPDEIIEEHINTFRKLSLSINLTEEEVVDIPETLLLSIDGMITLSGWGELVWKKAKDVLYYKQFWKVSSDKIVYSDKFDKSIKNIDPERYYILNKQFDLLLDYLENDRQNSLKSLRFHDIKHQNEYPGSTHEFYAWSDNDARRFYCHYDEQNRLIIDLLGEHLK